MAEFFKRVEKKYIINQKQYQILKEILGKTMIEDEHGESTICNIYFDTEDYELIRHSITKPIFKDKIRLRSYNVPSQEDNVFLEIKRKYDKVVSKRRIAMKLSDYYKMNLNNPKEQIERELAYYFKLYKLTPKVYLSYSRTAYYDKEDKGFRITFDSNIIARTYDLKLESGSYGETILPKGQYIMEIKTLNSIPLWLVKYLNDLKIVPGSFSKYGEAYTQLILEKDRISEYAV